MRLHDLMETVWIDWGIRISKYKAQRARRRGQALIVGEYKEQYALLPRYAAEIMRSNRGNTVKLKLNGTVFDRIYICFKALRKGLLDGCRPFISLDGCFLKGPYGGQLLVAVGRDGNNQMFPLAWAVVGVESTDTWSWFLDLLAADLGTREGVGGVFSGSLEYRKQFWIIAKSTTENDFLDKLQVLRELSNDAAEDLLKRNYKKWCRAFDTPMASCDSVDNYMSEVFNAYILKWRIQQQLEKHKVWARGWNAYWDGGFCYGGKDGETQTGYGVNLVSRTCSCNAWKISGIPCKHGVVAIWNKVDQLEQYVNDYFRKHTYAKAYDHLLEPLNGPQEWPTGEFSVSAPEIKKRNAPRESPTGVQTSIAAPTDPGPAVPMHNRGVGVYTYPNGFQRQATPLPQTMPRQSRGAAFYSDNAREQTVYSVSQEYTFTQSQPEAASQSSQTISSQALQDLAKAKQVQIRDKNK
ncbi:uncharacterized protein LOC110706441 [Chenopodium quinoa]|uniref:uncharacterized protein LOC110706441 n=1 Tax=Chenopodium quinoa TaxID=63459 RepID=UPI000B7965EC|nr:uncharacterized protein LOC110706441 [Chenopodium quinoa]